MNKHKLLSIVIPTYNMEKYLAKCLNSLVNTKKALPMSEILIINDGSKDASSEIAYKYQEQYLDSVIVIDKENGNYGSCINAALKVATGKYIKVLDADDWFDSSAFDDFIEKLKNLDVDLILTDYSIWQEKSMRKKRIKGKYMPNDNVIFDYKNMRRKEFLNMTMHAVTYRTQLLTAMNYTQTEGISYTDQEWIFYPMQHVNSIIYYPINLYQYLLGRSGQTMNASVMIKSLNHQLLILQKMIMSYPSINNMACKEKQAYLEYRLKRVCITAYKLALLIQNEHDYQNNEAHISSFDQMIKVKMPVYYNIMNEYVIHPILPLKFIAYWRKYHKRYPDSIRCLNSILKRIQDFLSL